MTVDENSPRVGGVDPEIIRFMSRREYPAWQRRIEAIRACEHPIRLVGRTVVSDAETGEIVEVFDSEDQPYGKLLILCGNRRASRCMPCSQLYQADTFHLIRAGIIGGKGVPESVVTHPMGFLTLTAPSFGLVHTRVLETDVVQRCHSGRKTRVCAHGRPLTCGKRHGDDDPQLGSPLCLDCFGYRDAVMWNAHAPKLWSRFTDVVRRVTLPYELGLTPKECAAVIRVSFAKVAEYQRRSLVHFHAVIRIDGANGPSEPPPDWVTTESLMRAISAALSLVLLKDPQPSAGYRELRFGEQFDFQPIVLSDADEALRP